MAEIKPINGQIFLERDARDETHSDMYVSEKAQVDNLKATVAFCEADSVLLVGERTLVPYYNAQNVVVDGRELTTTKAGNLFAKEKTDGSYQPINDFVMVRKCENEHVLDSSGDIALYMTEHYIEFTQWVEVIDVGAGCKHIKPEHIGLFCVAPEDDERLARIGYSKDFCLREDAIEFLTTGE